MLDLLPVSLGLLSVAGAIDALLRKYTLFARSASKRDHLVHTFRAVLLLLTLWLGDVSPGRQRPCSTSGWWSTAWFDGAVEHQRSRARELVGEASCPNDGTIL